MCSRCSRPSWTARSSCSPPRSPRCSATTAGWCSWPPRAARPEALEARAPALSSAAEPGDARAAGSILSGQAQSIDRRPRGPGLRRHHRRVQWRRMIGAPMLKDGKAVGVIVVAWSEPGEIPQRQRELLKTFADQAVIAIENVRLFNETRRGAGAADRNLRGAARDQRLAHRHPTGVRHHRRARGAALCRRRRGCAGRGRAGARGSNLRPDDAVERDVQGLSRRADARLGDRRRAYSMRGRNVADIWPTPARRRLKRSHGGGLSGGAGRADLARGSDRRRDLGRTARRPAPSPPRRSICCRPSPTRR